MRNVTVDIGILVTSRNGDKKNHAIFQNNEWTSLENIEVEPVEPVQMNMYQSNIYRKDLSWLHFNDKPRIRPEGFKRGSKPRTNSLAYPFLKLT